MTSLIAPTPAIAMARSTTTHAGGPVVIWDEAAVVAEKPASSAGILPLLLVGIVLCVALCGNDEDRPIDR